MASMKVSFYRNDKNSEVTAGVDPEMAAAVSGTHQFALDLIAIVMILFQSCL